MLKFIKIYYPALIGGLLGYLYYHYIGCLNGSCPISGNPYISTIYGAFIGSIFVIDKLRKKKGNKT
jgi:hypothetical protein